MPRASHTHEPATPRREGEDAQREVIVFDRDAVRAVDRAAVDEYGIPGIVLMENAARGLCEQAMRMLRHADPAASVLIVCGSGNNGGDGYALARHLHNRGVNALIATLGEPKPESDAGVNRSICEKMRLQMAGFERLDDGRTSHTRFALIVDAIFGTGLDRAVSGAAARAIEWINGASVPVLAVDVPSGMDCNTGKPLGACVHAMRTVTFVGLKAGFLELDAQKLLGEVHVADIGAPRELLDRFGTRVRLARRPDAPAHRDGTESVAARRRHS